MNNHRTSAEDFRAAQLAAMPRWYSPFAHLAGTLSVGVIAVALALTMVHHVHWYEFLVCPIAFLFANFFEWWAHKNILHRPQPFLRDLYEKHTPLHHHIYRWGDMAIRDRRELRFVLVPASGVLGIVLSASPVAFALGLLFTSNVGWIALMTMALYVIMYEMTHLTYHLPETHILHRLPFVDKLAEHHARHHDLTFMGRWNFNVTIPLADFVLGTFVPKKVLSARRKKVGLLTRTQK